MFCHKCGTKVADDSSFCHGCGAKVMQKGAAVQVSADPIIIPTTTVEIPTASVEPENTRPAEPIPQQTSSTSVEILETYDRLKESTQRCPKIKKIAISKGANGTSGSSLIIHGLFYRYIYTPSTSPEKTSMSWSLTWILYLVYVPILLCDAIFLQFFFQKEYYLALTICCLVGCMIWFPFLFFSYKEKKEITIHVNETFNCEMKLPSKARLVVFNVLNLIEIGLCIAAFVFGFGGSTDASSISIDNSASTTFENISLSQTYENKDEGISFMYPTSWQHVNENDFELRKEMIGSSSLILELYTLDNLENEENYYATHMQVVKEPTNLSFYGTKDDFQSSLSLTMNEVNVTQLLDIDLNGVPARKLSYLFNDNGQTCAVIEYYYAIGDDMYGIRFYTLQKNFDKYESIFHAIINSYIITTANSSGESDSDIIYFVEFSESYSEGYEPAIMLYQDGRFSFLANVGEGVGFYNGTFTVNGDIYVFNVTETEFSGNKTSFEFEFSMRLNGDTLIYESEDSLGLTMKGSVFSLSATPPKSIIDASSYEGTYEGEAPFGYEGEEGDYEPTQEAGFQRSDYFTGITRTDLLRYPDNNYYARVYFSEYKVSQILEPKLYLAKYDNLIANDTDYLIIDDRLNSGANALVGDRVAVYGTFSGNNTVNFNDGRSQQVSIIAADRFMVNSLLPNTEELAKALVESMNNSPFVFGNDSKYISGTTVQLVMGVYGMGKSTDISIFDGSKMSIQYQNPKFVGDVDGYTVTINPKLSPELVSPKDAGVQLSEDELGLSPIRVNATITSIEQNPFAPYMLKLSFNIESFEPY